MNVPDLLHDMRTTFRCPVAESRSPCTLVLGGETLPARLVDESAGGFAVYVDYPINLEIGQTIQLETDSGRFKVSVRSIEDVSSPENREDGDGENLRRLGLQRLGDAVPEIGPWPSPFAWGFRRRLRQWFPSNQWLSLSGVLLMLGTLFVPLGLAVMLWTARTVKNDDKISVADPWSSHSREEPGRGTLPISPPSSDEPVDRPQSALSFLSGWGENPRETHVNSETELRKLVRWLPGPTSLGLPEVARRLKLSEEQQKTIRRIIDAMAAAMREIDLDPLLRGVERSRIGQLREKLFDDHLRQAVEVLTPEQQAEWKMLRDKPAVEQ
ncbi:MAG: hypothetical protein JW959_08030 [Pirellulales bacterium]|nr:hypothetical protein [Pirellulales bacterium]